VVILKRGLITAVVMSIFLLSFAEACAPPPSSGALNSEDLWNVIETSVISTLVFSFLGIYLLLLITIAMKRYVEKLAESTTIGTIYTIIYNLFREILWIALAFLGVPFLYKINDYSKYALSLSYLYPFAVLIFYLALAFKITADLDKARNRKILYSILITGFIIFSLGVLSINGPLPFTSAPPRIVVELTRVSKM